MWGEDLCDCTVQGQVHVYFSFGAQNMSQNTAHKLEAENKRFGSFVPYQSIQSTS